MRRLAGPLARELFALVPLGAEYGLVFELEVGLGLLLVLALALLTTEVEEFELELELELGLATGPALEEEGVLPELEVRDGIFGRVGWNEDMAAANEQAL